MHLHQVQHWTYDLLKERGKSKLKERSMGLGEFDSTTYPITSKKLEKNIIQFQKQNVLQQYLSIPLLQGQTMLSDADIHNESKEVSYF